jgi:MSHA biogenesis protein MshJ
MKQHFVKVMQNVDRLSLRERLFLFTAALVVLGGLWEALLAAPLEAREQIAADKVSSLQERLQTLNQSMTSTADGMSEGMPNQLERLRALRERVAAGDEAVRIFTSDLVDAAQMRLVLEELIRRQSGLRLLSAVNLEVHPLFESAAPDQDTGAGRTAPNTDAPKLYRHTLVLNVKGSYLDCLAYLQQVERLPWQLYWGRLEFSADSYPVNDIVIELRTLSLEEEWIGV